MKPVIRASRIQTIFVVTTSLLLVLAGSSWAQEAQEAEDPEGATPTRASEIENITITAERRETLLEETPVSVSAFTPTAIEELNINNVATLSEFTPNLNIHVNAGGNTGATIGIRGAITSDPILSLEPTVGIYLNGVYIGHSVGSLFDLPDLSGIEVLRGPQGTLYGRNTVGGAITLNNVRPSGEWGLRQQFRAGNFYAFRSQTSVDFPLFGDKGFFGVEKADSPSWLGTFSGRATFQYEMRDGFYANNANDFNMPNLGGPTLPPAGTAFIPGSKRLDDLDRWTALIAVNWQLPGDVEIDYTFDNHHAREEPSAFQSTYVYPGSPVDGFSQATVGGDTWNSQSRLDSVPNNQFSDVFQQDSDLESNLDIWGHAINIHRQQQIGFMGDVTLKAIIGLREIQNDDAVDYDGTPIHIQDFGLDIDQDQISVEAQWLGHAENDAAGTFDYVLGFFYFNEVATAVNNLSAFSFVPGAPPGTLDPTEWTSFGASTNLGAFTADNISYAGYGQATWNLPWLEERLSLTGGLRYTYEDKRMDRSYDCVMFPPQAPAVSALCPAAGQPLGDFQASAKKTFDDWSPMASLQGEIPTDWFQPLDNWMTYFRFAKGFKSGGFNGRANTEATFVTPFKSEKLYAYEGGFRTAWFERRLVANISGFYSDYKDLQTTLFFPTPQGLPLTVVANAADATIGGLELEMVAIPIDGLDIRLAYAYLHPDYKKFDYGGLDISDQASFVLAPENTVSAGIGYTLPSFSFGTLGGRVDMYWQDNVVFEVLNGSFFNSGENKQSSYTTMSARIELRDIQLGGYGDMAVAIWGRNLTDTYYKNFGIDWSDAVGNVTSSFGNPRTYGVDITFNF